MRPPSAAPPGSPAAPGYRRGDVEQQENVGELAALAGLARAGPAARRPRRRGRGRSARRGSVRSRRQSSQLTAISLGTGMVQSKTLRPDWLPAVALSFALALFMVIWSPPVGDLAAQVFRTELFERAAWRSGTAAGTAGTTPSPTASSSRRWRRCSARSWWGCSRSSPPPTSSTASSATAGAPRRAGRRSGSPPASSPCSPTASSPSPSASPSGSPRCASSRSAGARSGWRPPRPAPSPARSPGPSSPASLIAGVARTRQAGQPGRARGRGAGALPHRRPQPRLPRTGQFPFVLSSFVAIPFWCAGALILTDGLRGEERQLRRVLVGYVLASTLIFLVPNALGGNAVRLGALFGGPVLAAVLLSRRPRADGANLVLSAVVLAVTMAGSLYWQVTASVSQIARSVGDPSTSATYFQPAAALAARPRRRGRADRGALDRQPLGGRLPGARLRPRPRLAAPGRHHPRRHLLRRRRAHRPHLQHAGCATTRSPTSPSPTRRSTTPRSPSAA